ncbi:MAG TPA: dihydroorotate dehydrogenase-like protein [Bacteroidales bacterium]|nr:dihydroorotate dehydrogenase-like protein [Bacteroidales bacterium]HQH23255.1 dihydroorotate dehydrogenase-like protein [Bacteroidales bacterium]HQJ80887.1 dihydroorotate dehydrogenase-like protein [Bacteroidales bacterium]
MADLQITYMGLKLKNPVIAGASNLSLNKENLVKIEKAGAAAVVYKSLFEEQFHLENLELYELRSEYEDRYAEMVTLFPHAGKEPSYPKDHLLNLRRAKETVSIPVIASLNAVYDESWVEYAVKIEETGVDALELNFYTVPEKLDNAYGVVEKKHAKIVSAVKAAVKIPVSVKLSPFYTNPLGLIYDIDKAGADGFVLFNRLFQPDIDIETQQHRFPYNLSNLEDKRLPLRFAGLLYGNLRASICTSSGIFNGEDVVKMILAGSDCVQVVSTLYLNQIEVIEKILGDIAKWMDANKYGSIDDFRGKLSRKISGNETLFNRTQYIDFHLNTAEILNKHKIF